MKELSTVQGTIGKLIKDNMATIGQASSQNELVRFCENLLKDSTNADRDNFLSTLKSKRGLVAAQTYIVNYVLKGDGLGTI